MVDKPAKEKQPAKSSTAKGLTVLSKVALTEVEQIKLARKRSLTQTHISHASGSGTDEGTGIIPGVPDVPAYESDDEKISWKDVNIHLEGRDIQMADVQTTQVIKDTHVTLTLVNPDGQQQSSFMSSRFVSNMLNPSPDTCIDSIFDSTPRIDVQVTTTAEPPLLSATTLPPPTISIILHMQQTPAPSPPNVPNNQGEVKEQVKVQVSKILPKIEKTANEQLEAEVLTHSSNSYYDVATDLSELELKKILIEKMESNKSIYRSDEQKNLYKALVDAYECPREDKKEKNQSQPVHKRKRHPRHLASQLKGPNLNTRLLASLHQQRSQCTQPKIWKNPHLRSMRQNKTLPATHGRIQPWISNLAKKADSRTSFNELMDTLIDFSAFVMNRLKVDTLTPKLLAGPTYELMKGSCNSLVELEIFLEEVYKATTDQLEWNNPEGQQYPHDLLKPLPLIRNSRGCRVIPFDHFINNDLEYLCGGASSRKYTTLLTKTKAADYGHIKWIEDLRLCIQDIKDMLLLLVRGKLTNLTVDERFAFNVTLRMFPRSIVIQRRVEDLQLGVKSYQNNINLTKPKTYRSYLKRKEAYNAYSNPRGFIYQNKDKQNRLMRIDELHKFSNSTLNDVHTALDNRLKGIRMQYLP
uniref:Uncharacterized protein n=1 Tax=Tanacetum cinerariifolium TaxID=118510 RepID=A0A6L2L2Y9_TANCI|nr:hypothetical protein [Tanacetum cinerariifolium]